jgi:hypothetical protein
MIKYQVKEVNVMTGEVIIRDMTPEEIKEVEDSYEEPIIDNKLIGVEFEGVMCSATRDDQNGLIAVITAWQLSQTAFKSVTFYFDNGNKLVITKDNIQAFIAVWMPFRQSFFEA